MIHYGNKSEINTSLYTYVYVYFRKCLFPYFRTKYFRTFVRKYFRTFVLSYFRSCTKVLPEVLRTKVLPEIDILYESTFVRRYCTFVVVLSQLYFRTKEFSKKYFRTVHVQCTCTCTQLPTQVRVQLYTCTCTSRVRVRVQLQYTYGRKYEEYHSIKNNKINTCTVRVRVRCTVRVRVQLYSCTRTCTVVRKYTFNSTLYCTRNKITSTHHTTIQIILALQYVTYRTQALHVQRSTFESTILYLRRCSKLLVVQLQYTY